MELQVKVTAQEAARLLVSVTEERLELGFGTGRKLSFEGGFGDITVRLITEGEAQPSVPVKTAEVPHSSEGLELSGQLFEKLTALRRQIASEANLPPYIIFHDSTLSEMCRVLPKDLQELKAIQGIGDTKLAKYGQQFLDVITEYTSSHRDVA